jgi:phospholipid N-methyltransferase
MAHHRGFLRQFLSNRATVGAIAPSSKGLARAITTPARANPGPRRWLEVGPGTGVFTRELIQALKDGDHFDVVELNEAFCQTLRADVLPAGGDKVVLHEGSIEDASLGGNYDAIVCGLPYNAFPTHVSRAILRRLVSLLREGGTLSFFEYAAIRHLRSAVSPKPVKRAMQWHAKFIARLEQDMRGRRDLVMMNMPPAWAVHLTKDGTPQ